MLCGLVPRDETAKVTKDQHENAKKFLRNDKSGLTLSLIFANQKGITNWAWLVLDIDGHRLERFTYAIAATQTAAAATAATERKVYTITLKQIKSSPTAFGQAKTQLLLRAKFLDAIPSITKGDTNDWEMQVCLVAAMLKTTPSSGGGTECLYDEEHATIKTISLERTYCHL
jgi:hypothetical protein